MAFSKGIANILPPEILVLVMQQISTPKDLISLRLTSSTFSRIFELNKSVILMNVARNAFHPAIFTLAATVCVASKEFCLSTKEEVKNSMDVPRVLAGYLYPQHRVGQIKKYIDPDEYVSAMAPVIDSLQYHFSTYINSTLVTSLYRLWNLLDCCITTYSQYNADRHCKPRSRVSDYEYMRIQRAFLSFELYRTLFGGRDAYTLNYSFLDIDVMDALNNGKYTFVSHLDSQERAELWSIYCYLKTRMIRIYGTIDTYIIKSTEEAPKRERPRESPTNKDLCYVEFIRNRGSKRRRKADFLLELGLPFCTKFFKMRVEEQAAIALSYFELEPLRPLSYHIKLVTEHTSYLRRMTKTSIYYQDAPALPRRRSSSSVTEILQNMSTFENYGLNGYFIWDEDPPKILPSYINVQDLMQRLRTLFAPRRALSILKLHIFKYRVPLGLPDPVKQDEYEKVIDSYGY